jgi:hypothetical protein
MTTVHFRHALLCFFLLGASNAFPADDSLFKEAQDAILGSLDLPLGSSGEHSIYIRSKGVQQNNAKRPNPESPTTFELWKDAPAKKRFGDKGIYELWNPKLHLRLSESEALSAADKLNGIKQPLWQGEAILKADAYREVLNPEAINGGELQYERWNTLPSNIGFTVVKTVDGWGVTKKLIPASTGGETPFDKVISLSLVPAAKPSSSFSESEVRTAFTALIHDQTPESLMLVERKTAEPSNFINVDTYHEFHAPVLEFATIPPTDAQALNGEVIVSVRINCDAHRFPKIVKSKTAQTPANMPREVQLWADKETWRSGPTSKNKGDCDYIGIRKDGKWTFTVSDFLLDSEWLQKVVLLPKSDSPKPEDELPAAGNPAKRPPVAGIGAVLEPLGTVVVIKSLAAGGPAERSGQLKAGDRIVALATDDPPDIWGKINILETDNQNYRDTQFLDIIKQLRGPAGKAVYLRVLPAGTNDPSQLKEIKIIREIISVK